MGGKVEGFRLSAGSARQILREAAADSGRVFFTHHAERRMKQRRITRTQVLRCPRSGAITEEPVWSATRGSWELRVEYLTAGDAIVVAAAIDPEKLVIVITVFQP